ncbi:DUF4185 domain-containing protein [Thermodesulfobacteriota bacterium]
MTASAFRVKAHVLSPISSAFRYPGPIAAQRRLCSKAAFVLLALFLLALSAAPAAFAGPSARVDACYNALFAGGLGWTGADGAYSVELSENVILWLFGDTLVGRVDDGKRDSAALIHNSVAVQRGIDPCDASMEFFFYAGGGSCPRAFFTPGDGRGWFWPYHATRCGGTLILFLMQVEKTDAHSLFGFRLVSPWVVVVTNPDDSPLRWEMSQHKMPWGGSGSEGELLFGSAVLNKAPFVYVYGTVDQQDDRGRTKHMILARARREHLVQFDRWRFYSESGWQPRLSMATLLCGDMANEYSVSFLPALGEYVAVYSESGLSRNIVARRAPMPWGPWGEAEFLYRCPEPDWEQGVFCYAAKAHAALSSSPAELIVSYVASATDIGQLEDDARLYRPRFLRVSFLHR